MLAADLWTRTAAPSPPVRYAGGRFELSKNNVLSPWSAERAPRLRGRRRFSTRPVLDLTAVAWKSSGDHGAPCRAPCTHGRGRQSARAVIQRWGPDKRQPIARHRRPPPYSTCENANGYEKSCDWCPKVCFLHFALTAHYPLRTAHCPLCPRSLLCSLVAFPGHWAGRGLSP